MVQVSCWLPKMLLLKSLEQPRKGLEKPALTVILREMFGFIKTLDKGLTDSGTVCNTFQIENLIQLENNIYLIKFNHRY